MVRVLRPISGVPGYLVGNDGTVWSRWKTRGRPEGRGVDAYISNQLVQLSLKPKKSGYQQAGLRKDGKYLYFYVHQLVLTMFRGPAPEKTEGCHKNGIKTDNRLSNLYWGTRKQNTQDSIRLGTFRCTEAAALVNRGKERPESVRKKISESHLGKKKTDSHRASIRAAHWSKRLPPEAVSEIMRKVGARGGRNRHHH